MLKAMLSNGLAMALEWLNGELIDDPEVDSKRKLQLIERASMSFNLKPAEGDYLHKHLKVNKLSREQIREKHKAIKDEISALEQKIVEKKQELIALMGLCKHPKEVTVQDSNLHCPDCGHFD